MMTTVNLIFAIDIIQCDKMQCNFQKIIWSPAVDQAPYHGMEWVGYRSRRCRDGLSLIWSTILVMTMIVMTMMMMLMIYMPKCPCRNCLTIAFKTRPNWAREILEIYAGAVKGSACRVSGGQSPREVVGQHKSPILNFFQQRELLMEQYHNTEQCPIQPVNRICNRRHPLHLLQSNTESYFLWIIIERKEKVKVPSTPFFANRASNFVLLNLATNEIAHSCPKYHPWYC